MNPLPCSFWLEPPPRTASKSSNTPQLLEARITLTTRISDAMAEPVQPRAIGRVALSVKLRDGKTVLDTLRQSGSFRCLFPRQKAATLESVLVNTAGGITGGDSFQVAATVATGCALTLTTQACERAYRAQAGAAGQLETSLTVAKGGHINWVPQETILFNKSHLNRTLTLNMAQGASALLVEPMVFGRATMGEELTHLQLHDRIEIVRDGAPVFIDATRFDGDMAAHLDRPHIAAGARAMALIAYVAPDAESHLAPLRALLPPAAGASVIGEDLLVARLLAPDSYALRQSLVPILNRLSQNQLPRCWMI